MLGAHQAGGTDHLGPRALLTREVFGCRRGRRRSVQRHRPLQRGQPVVHVRESVRYHGVEGEEARENTGVVTLVETDDARVEETVDRPLKAEAAGVRERGAAVEAHRPRLKEGAARLRAKKRCEGVSRKLSLAERDRVEKQVLTPIHAEYVETGLAEARWRAIQIVRRMQLREQAWPLLQQSPRHAERRVAVAGHKAVDRPGARGIGHVAPIGVSRLDQGSEKILQRGDLRGAQARHDAGPALDVLWQAGEFALARGHRRLLIKAIRVRVDQTEGFRPRHRVLLSSIEPDADRRRLLTRHEGAQGRADVGLKVLVIGRPNVVRGVQVIQVERLELAPRELQLRRVLGKSYCQGRIRTLGPMRRTITRARLPAKPEGATNAQHTLHRALRSWHFALASPHLLHAAAYFRCHF